MYAKLYLFSIFKLNFVFFFSKTWILGWQPSCMVVAATIKKNCAINFIINELASCYPCPHSWNPLSPLIRTITTNTVPFIFVLLLLCKPVWPVPSHTLHIFFSQKLTSQILTMHFSPSANGSDVSPSDRSGRSHWGWRQRRYRWWSRILTQAP